MENQLMPPTAVFTVTEKAERSLRGGHPWVFAEEITGEEGEYANGGLVQVRSRKGRFLGTGFVCLQSKIRVRIISTNANDRFDEAFWARRIKYAIDYRRTVMATDADFACCRLIFGEADSFPGLTVDRFGPVLVTQCLSRGIEGIKSTLYRLLVEDLRSRGEQIDVLYERNDVKIRELEGMEQAVTDMIELLNPGGRLAIITFHGTEDTLVKHAMRAQENRCICPRDLPVCACGRQPRGKMTPGKPIIPSPQECEENPRARSAKLRVFIRNDKPL